MFTLIMKKSRLKQLKAYKTSNNEHDWTPVKYLNVLHHNRTQSSCDNFFLIYCKNYQFPILVILDMYGHFYQKG